MKENIFESVMNSFENEDIKRFFVDKCLPTIPEYMKIVPASSSGKYHSRISLGEGGLMRHTLALVRIMNYMFEVESVAKYFTSRERDLLRIAGLLHDSRKSGTQEDYERNKHTKFDHPLQAAAVVRSLDGLDPEEIELIAHAVESHMGIWCTSKRDPGVVLPTPKDKYQIVVHLADYIVSRRDVELLFDNLPEVENRPDHPKKLTPDDIDVNEFQIKFGKYAGLTWPEIEAENPGYLDWGKDKEGFAFDVLRKYLKEKTS